MAVHPGRLSSDRSWTTSHPTRQGIQAIDDNGNRVAEPLKFADQAILALKSGVELLGNAAIAIGFGPVRLAFPGRQHESIGGHAVGLSARLAPIAVLLAANLLTTPAWAEVFRVGEVDGLFDVSLAYGLLTRTESRELNFIGIGNAGEAASVNVDDGDLNYDKGVVSNGVRATAELTLKWRNFGSYVRGYGFYDFETELDEREHSALSSDADDLVGRGGDFQDHYLNAALDLGSVPVQLRVGNQVLNWGESGFLRFGVDVVNPRISPRSPNP